MKKNKIMRLASGLLVAVLLTTCAISGTFAKYVTTGSGTDTARVAKWGVTIDGSGMEVFKNAYGTTVIGSTKVVAPGTNGTFAEFKIKGTPEVSVKITYSAVVTLSGNWTDGTNFYCPLKVTVGSNTLCGLDYANAAAFQTAIADHVAAPANTFIYDPNTNLSSVAEDDLTISWKWDFEGDGNTYLSGLEQTDAADTVLGNWSADADAANDPTISITVNCLIEQID